MSVNIYAGLQYTDSIYVSTVMTLALPLSMFSLYGVFVSNAKMMRYLYFATYTVAFWFLFFVACACNTGRSSKWSIPMLTLFILGPFYGAFYKTEEFAMPTVTFANCFVHVALLFQFIANFTPLRLGLLSLFPSALVMRNEDQFTVTMLFFIVLAASLTAWLFLSPVPSTQKDAANVLKRVLQTDAFQASLLSSYLCISGLSYVAFLTGLMASKPIDLISLTAVPSHVTLDLSHIALLTAIYGLTYEGYCFQQKRDSPLIHLPDEGIPIIESGDAA